MQCTALWAQEFFCGHWCRVMDGQVAALKSICKYQTSKTSHSIQIFKMRMHISGLHLEYMTGGLPVNQLPWKRSEQSGVFKKKALVLLWAVFENALPRLLVKNDFVDFQSRWALFRNRPKAAIQPPIKYSVMLEHQLLPQTAYSSLKSCFNPFKNMLHVFPQ